MAAPLLGSRPFSCPEKSPDGGWPSLSCSEDFGGQGLPYIINSMFYEMLNSTNQSWAMYPGLTHGTYAAIFTTPLAQLTENMTKITTQIGLKSFQNPDEVGAASVDYLRIVGHLVFAYLFAKMASIAQKEINNGNKDSFYLAKIETARFYFKKLFPETLSLIHTANSGSKSLMDTNHSLA